MDIQKSPEQLRIGRRHRIIKSLKARADERRSGAEKFADWLTNYFGTVTFLSLNAAWFTVWIVVNTGLVPGVAPFDPFPFGLLTMIVSLEAIFLAIIVLISQNRAERVADLREEIDLQINTIAEKEVTKIMRMLATLLEKNGLDIQNDVELQEMLRPVDSNSLQQRLEKQLNAPTKN
jgi:uncharacterized membrane protein